MGREKKLRRQEHRERKEAESKKRALDDLLKKLEESAGWPEYEAKSKLWVEVFENLLAGVYGDDSDVIRGAAWKAMMSDADENDDFLAMRMPRWDPVASKEQHKGELPGKQMRESFKSLDLNAPVQDA